MKTVLAYGDSLTWGSDPEVVGKRHPASHRWPDVVAARLGESVQIVADGMRGRTTAYDDHTADCDRNGARLLPSAIYTHAPVDLVVIMLGSNDMKPHICETAMGARQGMRRLVEITQTHTQGLANGHRAKALVVAPPPLAATDNAEMAETFAGGREQSEGLEPAYRSLAGEMGVVFFDAGTVAEASPADGVHLDAANTQALGEALAPIIAAMLED